MLPYLFVLLAIAVRFLPFAGSWNVLPHAWHFTPVASSLMFFGARGSRRQMWVPLVLLAATDVVLTKVIYSYTFSWDHLVTWAWYAAILWLGTNLREKSGPVRVIGAALASSVSFFLISNFAVWAVWRDMYPRTANGLAMSYVAGLPFFRNTVASDLLFSAAFFGIGMYIVAGGLDLMPYPALVVLAGLAGAIFAAVVGLATLRISGVYFVIFTLGLAELVRQVMAWAQHVMGTSSGLYVLIGMSDATLYWLLLAMAALVYLVGWWIGRSRLGFALRIIGNDEVVAVHSGINTARAKVVLFVISGTFAAITGALVAPRYSYVEPTLAFSPFLSFETVIMALLGGEPSPEHLAVLRGLDGFEGRSSLKSWLLRILVNRARTTGTRGHSRAARPHKRLVRAFMG